MFIYNSANIVFPENMWVHLFALKVPRGRFRLSCYTLGLHKGNKRALVGIENMRSNCVFVSRSMKRVFFTLAFVVLGFGTYGYGQRPTPTPPPGDDLIGTTKVFEVRLPVTVTHKKELVAGLTRGDFIILEDGVQQEVTFFSDEKTNPPVFVGVLMDTSPSAAG